VQIGAMVAGRVYDSDTDLGVANVTITARPENIPVAERKETNTDANGYYLIQGMHAGNYRVEYSEIKNYPRDMRWEDRKEVVTALGQRLAGLDFPVRQGISISGTVVDTRGDPVNQAWINGSIQNGNTRDSGQSDESGNFSIYGFNPNTTVSLNVSANEFARELESVKIENESVSGVRIVMDPEGKISGVVVDASGRPVPSVSLYTREKDSNDWGGSDDSNAQGEFELEQLKAGTYYIKPSVNNSYSSNDPTLETVTLARGQHLEGVRIVWHERDGSYQISGNVTDDQGNAISGARVYAYGGGGGGQIQSTSGPEGNYVLQNIEAGMYTLNFQSQKHTPQNLQQIDAGSSNANVVMTRTGSISGTIVDGINGEPVTDFNLLLVNGQFQSHMEQQFKRYHHADGEFTLEGAYPNQSVSIMVRATGYAETTIPVAGVHSGDTVSNVLISMEGESTVSGVVVDQRGNRLSGVSIFKGPLPRNEWERDRGVKVRSNFDGEFTMGGLSRGEMTISAYLKGLSPDTQAVNIGSGTNKIQFVLTEGASIEGVVTVDGKPAPNVSIYGNIFDGSDGQRGFDVRGTTDDAGFYSIGGVPEGRGSVSANLSRGGENRNMSVQIEVATGMTTEVNFIFESATSSVEGYIMISETETSSGRVSLSINTGGNTESRYQEVSGDGHYLFESLPAGTVSLRAWGGSTQRQKSVSAELGENESIRLDLKMYGGTTIHCLVANPPADKVVFAAILQGDTVVPAKLDMGFFQMLTTAMVGQAQVTNGVGTVGGIENGSYLVLIVAYSAAPDGVNFSSMQVATTPVVVQDQPELEVEVSF
ncbi:MAG: carboxypeptidase regulatory-like domain-containing protein, partial [Candidatus Hydrogenedentota bacterium]